MSRRQRPHGIWELWDGLRSILEGAGIKPPVRTREHDWMSYERFATGLTFTDVVRMLWVPSPDPSEWRRKSRGPILYTWWRLKQEMWAERERREDDAFLLAARSVPMTEPGAPNGPEGER